VIAAVVALAAVAVVLAGVLAGLSWTIQRERHEWVTERRALVDRVIAQHTGEVIALDRAQKPKREREVEPVPIEGLN
jgi:hypothetical protein